MTTGMDTAPREPSPRPTRIVTDPAMTPTMSAPSPLRAATGSGARATADSPRLLREINDQVVLSLLLDRGPLTRGQIGEFTGLSKPTVSSLLDRLGSRGLVATTGVVAGGPGPNARIYGVNPSAGHVIGVHVEQHACVAGLAALTGDVIATDTVTVPQRRDSDPIREVTAAVEGVLATASLGLSAVDHVVVATPGVIDPATGILRHARHLHGWEAPGIASRIADSLGLPVTHGNDVNLAAVAEGIRGSARGEPDFALLWLGTGVGLGLVLGGVLRAGAHGGAGEIGYLPASGLAELPRVDRGAAGAFQQLAGGQGIRALARQHGIRGTDPAAIVAAAAAAGPAGHRLLADLGDRIALGAASIATVVDPGVLILGGPVALAGGPVLVDLVRAGMGRISFVRPPIRLSTVTADGVLHGAIEVGLQILRSQLFGEPVAARLG
jgi:predicted NBD/HSP70 family sugar kinase